MKTLDEALKILTSQAKEVEELENVLVQEALGRVLGRDALSLVNVPPLDNSQMDGYAVRAEDIKNPGQELEVSQRIPAGYLGKPLKENTVARIFTGASVPEGANAIVMQEACEVVQSEPTVRIRINEVPKANQWIRRQGEDLTANQVALKAGSYLRPQELGVAASGGLTHLTVKRKVKVSIFLRVMSWHFQVKY